MNGLLELPCNISLRQAGKKYIEKMAMGICSIQFIAHAIPIRAKIQFVHALVHSHINYALVVYKALVLYIYTQK